ncbi:RNA polymerase sigma-70 factor [Bacteroides sedimenti]|uniref:RNA polymerase sigma-70 factor n=1 Tax=Bacteroides sedimenti TaxID=2136147 RepID=A0ABM8IAD5_9BACE
MNNYNRKSVSIIDIDEMVIVNLNKGDMKAFRQIYDAFYVYLCTIATAYIFDRDVAREVVNDVFVNLWENRENITYPITPYLKKAVQNRSLNYIRSIQSRERVLTEAEELLNQFQEEYITSTDTPLSVLEKKEVEDLILDAVNNLPERCRAIFTDNLYNNKSYDEIAESYGITVSTVRVQIKIALTKVKDALNPILTYLFIFSLIFFIFR